MHFGGSGRATSRAFHHFLLVIAVQVICTGRSFALIVNIIQGTTNAPTAAYVYWEQIASAMGHTAMIHPSTFLDVPANLDATDILILSVATDATMYDPGRIANIIQFLQQGGKVYLQSEYDYTFAGNQSFQTILNSLGSSFSWFTGAPTPDYLSPLNTVGDLATNLNTVPPIMGSFWYGCTANCVEDVEGYLEFNGQFYGFMYCVPNSAGRILTMTDQDVMQTFYYPDVGLLMENIITNLSNDAYVCQANVTTPVDLGPDASICGGGQLTLGPIPFAPSIQWSDGSSGTQLVIDSPGTYWVSAGEPGCQGSDTIVVSIAEMPQVDLGPDLINCSGSVDIVPLLAEGGVPLWSTGEITSQITVTEPGEYTLEITNGCGTVSDAIMVGQAGSLSIDLGADLEICAGNSIALGPVPANFSIEWSDGSSGTELVVDQAGTYWVQVDDNGCIGSDTVQVDVVQEPLVQLPADVSTCSSTYEIVPLIAEGGPFEWSTGGSQAAITVVSSGTYSLQITNACGEITEQIVVDLEQIPIPDLGADTLICNGTGIQLQAEVPGPFAWSNGSTASALEITSPGTYWVTTGMADCLASDTIEVGLIADVAVDLGIDTTSCNGAAVQLVPASISGEEFLWSTGDTTSAILAGTSGTYELTVSNVCGEATDAIEVHIIPPIVIDLGPDTIICTDTSITLYSGISSGSLQWSDGSTQGSLIVDQPGTYSVTADLEGCTGTDQITIGITDPPWLQIVPDTIVICGSPGIVIDAQITNGTYVLWSEGSNGPSLFVDAPGTYIAMGSTGCGFVADTIRVSAAPEFAYPEDIAVCSGGSATVSFGEIASSVLWSTGSMEMTRELLEGEYFYEAIDHWGCVRTGDLAVLVLPEADGANFIPNSFSPNGDGVNDVFLVTGAEEEAYGLEIFDRWGEKIHQSNDPMEGWDGSSAPVGTYIYQLEFRSQCSGSGLHSLRGHVNLLR